jgi:hypothetical protein
LAETGWFPVSTTELNGRGLGPIAYQIAWAGKSVLFSGRIPIKVNQDSGLRLIADLTGPAGNLRAYLDSINRLLPLKPDLWLPAEPVDGQNANLYDHDWDRELEENLKILKFIVTRLKPR